jgi:hypothetical protein
VATYGPNDEHSPNTASAARGALRATSLGDVIESDVSGTVHNGEIGLSTASGEQRLVYLDVADLPFSPRHRRPIE